MDVDIIKDKCINQGYVPKHCKLNGELIWLLIKDGKNPCKGCNHDCISRINEENKYAEKEKRVEQFYSGNKKTIMVIDTEQSTMSIYVTVVETKTKVGYIKRFDDISTACSMIPMICRIYKVDTVIIDKMGWGMAISDGIKDEVMKAGIDFVAFVSRPLRL